MWTCVIGHVRKLGLVHPVGHSRFDVLFAMNVRIRVMLCKVLHCHCYTSVHKLLCMWEAHHRLARYMSALETPGHCHIRLTVYIICIAFGTPDRPTCTEKEPRPCCQHRDWPLSGTRSNEKANEETQCGSMAVILPQPTRHENLWPSAATAARTCCFFFVHLQCCQFYMKSRLNTCVHNISIVFWI